MFRRKSYQGVKCSRKQSVLRSKVFQGEECSRKQTVLRGNVFHRVKCAGEQSVPKEQNVPESKVFISLQSSLVGNSRSTGKSFLTISYPVKVSLILD